MKKNKYRIDLKTLSYEKVASKYKINGYHILWIFLSAIAFSFIIVILISRFFPTAKEKRLRSELNLLEKNYNDLHIKINQANEMYNQLDEKEKEIYKLTFDTYDSTNISESINEDFSDLSYDFDFSKMLYVTSEQLKSIESNLTTYFSRLKTLTNLVYEKQVFINSIPSIMPVDKNSFFIASGFGNRIHPFFKTLRAHNGIDIAARQGTPVYASADGIVVKPTFDIQGYGNIVVIKHDFEFISIYAQLLKSETRTGRTVKQGDLIGYVGASGIASGPHLHYEIWHNGNPVNPINYMFKSFFYKDFFKLKQKASIVNQSMS